jgi:uncharacterized protein YjbJ (UPF0337 family)
VELFYHFGAIRRSITSGLSEDQRENQPSFLKGKHVMDKGSAKEAKGGVKEIVSKAIGDAKLESDGKTDKVAGKVQNAVGGLKDTLRGK